MSHDLFVLVFLFVCTMEGARTRRRRTAPQAISPVGCCLARGFHRLGMSTKKAPPAGAPFVLPQLDGTGREQQIKIYGGNHGRFYDRRYACDAAGPAGKI